MTQKPFIREREIAIKISIIFFIDSEGLNKKIQLDEKVANKKKEAKIDLRELKKKIHRRMKCRVRIA
jgi:hypothetical protein